MKKIIEDSIYSQRNPSRDSLIDALKNPPSLMERISKGKFIQNLISEFITKFRDE